VNQYLDASVAKRMERLGAILDQQQLQAYEATTQTFREMMTKIISHGTRKTTGLQEQ
jgi:hypothetical protein